MQFYALMVEQAEEHTGKPSLPRFRQTSRSIDGGAASYNFSSAEDYYRYHFFYALDRISEQICDRFKQSSMFLPK